LSDTQSFVLNIVDVNDPPRITGRPITRAEVEMPYEWVVEATDRDFGDVMTYSLTVSPAGMTISPTSGLIQWTPTSDQNGYHPVTIQVQDREGLTDTLVFTLSVAKTYSIGPGESIQNTIDTANPGDTIVVRPGTYNETLNIDKADLAIQSSNGPEVTVIDGGGSGDAVVIAAPGVIFQGFTVTNSGDNGIKVLREAEDSIVRNNISSGHQISGIMCLASRSTVVQSNICESNLIGVALWPTGLYHCWNATINGNSMRYNSYGIVIYLGTWNTITYNDICYNGDGGVNWEWGSGAYQGGVAMLQDKGLGRPCGYNEVERNNIVGNSWFGVRNTSLCSLDGRGNWWGDPSGPSGGGGKMGEGADGSGDVVWGLVNYAGFLTMPVGDTGDPDDPDSSGGGCFIATAAYGTPMAEEIDLLRDLRDEYLLTNPIGEALVELYYSVSPPIAAIVAKHSTLRAAVRCGLVPVVTASAVIVHTTYAQKLMAATLPALVILTLATMMERKRRRA
jgi:parallel beta-helix repeat protein